MNPMVNYTLSLNGFFEYPLEKIEDDLYRFPTTACTPKKPSNLLVTATVVQLRRTLRA